MTRNPAYGILMFLGIAASAFWWLRVVRPRPTMIVVYIAGLLGALIGAKLGYIAAELPLRWHDPDLLQQLLWGKTILGGLLGGYAGVELGKKMIGHRESTGDGFAVAVPVGLMLGRIGCYLQGCCLGTQCDPAWYAVKDSAGIHRFPTTLLEATFHLAAAITLFLLYRKRLARLNGQLFHLYIIAYGSFRIVTEFYRDTPRIIGWLSPYQLLAAILIAFGLWRWQVRQSGNRKCAQTTQLTTPLPGPVPG